MSGKGWRRGNKLGPGLVNWEAGHKALDVKHATFCCLCKSSGQYSVTLMPGARYSREAEVCKPCLEAHMNNVYCAGCDREISSEGTQSEVVVGGRHEVAVCGIENSFSTATPKKQCRQKAREALSLCPGGCGARAEPGTICESCEGKIVEAERLRGSEPLHWVRVWIPKGLDPDVLARAVTGRGARPADISPSAKYMDAHVTLNQGEAVDQIVEAMRAMVEAAENRGRQEGGAFLTRLARGSVSMEELNQHHVGHSKKGQ